MNLILRFIDRLPEAVRNEIQQLVLRINHVWGVDHDPQTGAHRTFTFDGSTQTTVGAAGGASALPATPKGYMTVKIDGTEYVLPFYTKS